MVSVLPDPVYGSSTLAATASGTSNADGDPISMLMNGLKMECQYHQFDIPSTDLDVGEVWTVRVTPNDGYTDGTYTEVSVVIQNSDPTLTSPVISSGAGTVYNDSVLTCTSIASDADEVVSATYSWNIGGATVTGSTVDLSNYSISVIDSVECTACIGLQWWFGNPFEPTLIVNRSPSISSVSVSPSGPTSQDVLTCSVTSSDLDGESLTESIEWFGGFICFNWNDFDLVCWCESQRYSRVCRGYRRPKW